MWFALQFDVSVIYMEKNFHDNLAFYSAFSFTLIELSRAHEYLLPHFKRVKQLNSGCKNRPQYNYFNRISENIKFKVGRCWKRTLKNKFSVYIRFSSFSLNSHCIIKSSKIDMGRNDVRYFAIDFYWRQRKSICALENWNAIFQIFLILTKY